MLTKNFYQAFRAAISGLTIENAVTSTTGDTKHLAAPSNSAYVFVAFRTNNVSTSLSSAGVAFGTGTTPPTFDDYTLSGSIITTLSKVAGTITTSINDSGISYKIVLTVSNTGTEAVTLSEMCFLASGTTNGSTVVRFMVDRTVLDTPLTLAPSEQGVVTYTLNMPF